MSMRLSDMPTKSKQQSIHFSKKNDGQEIDLEFKFLAGRDMNSVDRIRVEEWVRKYGTAMLHAFKVEFPEINGGRS